MRFSVIIPSYLAPYAGAARDREGKLLRAINSCLKQTFSDFEVHVIADGCQLTMDLVTTNFTDERIKLWLVQHQKMWSGIPRNKGIDEAIGEFIIYLDIDDIYGDRHLEIINENLNGYDWVWFNDIQYNPKREEWYERHCDIRTISMHGTSNICHRRSLGLMWDNEGRYAHDYYFVQKFFQHNNFAKIATPEYYVCHIPGGVNGYDI